MANTPEKRVIKHYSKKGMVRIVKRVCELYVTGEYTLESCCENAGVPIRTWTNWWSTYRKSPDNDKIKTHCLAEVAALWETTKAIVEDLAKGELQEVGESMMIKLMKGWEYKQIKTEVKATKDVDGQEILIPVGQTITTKLVLPNAGMIQFILRSIAPEKYGNLSMNLKVNVDATKDKPRSLAEIQAEIDSLDALDNDL